MAGEACELVAGLMGVRWSVSVLWCAAAGSVDLRSGDQMSLVKNLMSCGTVLLALSSIASCLVISCECLMIADLSRCRSLPYAWCSLILVAAGVPAVDFTAFARNAINAWLGLSALLVIVFVKRFLYRVGVCVEGLDLYLAEDALKLV